MAPNIFRIFILGLSFVLTCSQSPIQTSVADTSTSNSPPLTPAPMIQEIGESVNQIIKEAQSSVPPKPTGRPSDIPQAYFSTDSAPQQLPTNQGSFTPIGYTGLGVPAAWQLQQPAPGVQPPQMQFPVQFPAQVPVQGVQPPQLPFFQVPGQLLMQPRIPILQLPAPVPFQIVQQPQTPIQQQQPALKQAPNPTVSPAAPPPTADPFNLFGGSGIDLMAGNGLFGGGGNMFGGSSGGMDLFGGGAGGVGSTGAVGGDLFGGLFGSGTAAGGGLFGGKGGTGGSNMLQTIMMMKMLGIGGDAPDPPPRGTKGRGGQGGQGGRGGQGGQGGRGAPASTMSQMSPIDRLAMLELRRMFGAGPSNGPSTQGGPGGLGPENPGFGPDPGYGPDPSMGGPPTYQPDYAPADLPPTVLVSGFSNDVQSAVVRGPPPPSFRSRHPRSDRGGNGISHQSSTNNARMARSVHTAVGHPATLTTQYLPHTPKPNNKQQAPIPLEPEVLTQEGQGRKTNKQFVQKRSPPMSGPVDQGQIRSDPQAGTKVASVDTKFLVFATQETPATTKTTQGVPVTTNNVKSGTVPSKSTPFTSQSDVPPEIFPSVESKASAPFKISQSPRPRGLPISPSKMPSLSIVGDKSYPKPTQGIPVDTSSFRTATFDPVPTQIAPKKVESWTTGGFLSQSNLVSPAVQLDVSPLISRPRQVSASGLNQRTLPVGPLLQNQGTSKLSTSTLNQGTNQLNQLILNHLAKQRLKGATSTAPNNIRQMLALPLFLQRMRLSNMLSQSTGSNMLSQSTGSNMLSRSAGANILGQPAGAVMAIGNADVHSDRADRMADMMDNMQSMTPLQRMMLRSNSGRNPAMSGGFGSVGESGGLGTTGAGNMGLLAGLTGTMPSSGGTMSGMGGTMQSSGGTMPSTGGTIPDFSGIMPGMGGASSGMGGTMPGMGGGLPDFGGIMSGMGGTMPGMGGTMSGMGGGLPDFGGIMSGMGGTMPGMGGTMPGMGGMMSGMGGPMSGFGGTQSGMGASMSRTDRGAQSTSGSSLNMDLLSQLLATRKESRPTNNAGLSFMYPGTAGTGLANVGTLTGLFGRGSLSPLALMAGI